MITSIIRDYNYLTSAILNLVRPLILDLGPDDEVVLDEASMAGTSHIRFSIRVERNSAEPGWEEEYLFQMPSVLIERSMSKLRVEDAR